MTITLSNSAVFTNGSVEMIKVASTDKAYEMYVVSLSNGYQFHELRKTWIGQIIQVFFLRLKYK